MPAHRPCSRRSRTYLQSWLVPSVPAWLWCYGRAISPWMDIASILNRHQSASLRAGNNLINAPSKGAIDRQAEAWSKSCELRTIARLRRKQVDKRAKERLQVGGYPRHGVRSVSFSCSMSHTDSPSLKSIQPAHTMPGPNADLTGSDMAWPPRLTRAPAHGRVRDMI
jgi:hypothetical protein